MLTLFLFISWNSLPNIFCVLQSKRLLPSPARRSVTEFLRATWKSKALKVKLGTMCGRSASKVSWKKLAPAEVFKVTAHQQPCQIVYLLAALLMWLHSVSSTAALLPQQRWEADSSYFSRHKRVTVLKNDLRHICWTIFNINVTCYLVLFLW